MKYSRALTEHFNHPRNVGQLNDATVCGRAGSRALGAFICFTFVIDDETISQVRFQAYGNPYVIASASLLTELVHGRSVQQVQFIDHKQLASLLEIPSTKLHSAILVIDAFQNALQECAAETTATF